MERYQAIASKPIIVTDREIPTHIGTNLVIGYIDEKNREYCPPELINIIKVHFPALMKCTQKPVDHVTIEGKSYAPRHRIV